MLLHIPYALQAAHGTTGTRLVRCAHNMHLRIAAPEDVTNQTDATFEANNVETLAYCGGQHWWSPDEEANNYCWSTILASIEPR